MQALIDFTDASSGRPGALRHAFDTPLETLLATTAPEVPALLDAVQRHARAGRWCVGYVRYEVATAFDAAYTVHTADGPLAWFGVYDHALAWPEVPSLPPARVDWTDGPNRADFDADLARIHAAIAAGELYQVNHTAALHGTLQGQPLALFQALQRAQPGGYAAFIDSGHEQLLSVSPELFFDWNREHILARPMKGTAPRGADAAEDRAREQALRSSPKERAENVMIVDLLRNDLSRVAEPHSVSVPRLFHTEALPTVWQMSSDVMARVRPGTTLAQVFGALFPCGSITGAPKVQAMRLIHALEARPRGVYCGAIGVVRPGGHATFNVAIRTVTVRGTELRCGIGSGITSDATAEGEWQEWRHKRAFLDRASQPFELLETLRLQDGQLYEAPRHLARMAGTARHFGFAYDAADLQAALQDEANRHPAGLRRLRLLLASDGTIRAESFAMEATPPRVRVQLAPQPLDAPDDFIRHKTTRRAHYEALAPRDPAVFDTLLCNTRGELTEGTRCNVAVKLAGRWLTPALACGLLGGVGREIWLEQGRIAEAVIPIEALRDAEGLAVFNSLRGWIEAELSEV